PGMQHTPKEPPDPGTGPAASDTGGPNLPVEPEEDAVAVRPRAGAEDVVAQKLSAIGRVQSLEAQRLLIVELPEVSRRQAALDQLEQWKQQGLIEFATPVLRHKETQQRRILTDEITVRLKPDAPQEHLRAV